MNPALCDFSLASSQGCPSGTHSWVLRSAGCFAPGHRLEDRDLAVRGEHRLIPSLMEEGLLRLCVCQGCFSLDKEDLRRPHMYVLA